MGPGGLPYEVGCPAFTREVRQFQWPSHCKFKPDVGEKYNGKTHPSEFLSIYTIAMQVVWARDDKVLANYFLLAHKPNVMSWLMHLPMDSISSWSDLCHEFVIAFTGELRQFQWPSHRTFKPDVGEKYNGKTHPSEFLSI